MKIDLDIHGVIAKLTPLLDSINDLTRVDIRLFNLNEYIQAFGPYELSSVDEYQSLFDISGYCKPEQMPKETIKVCKKLIWYIGEGFNVRIDLNITEEEFFQNSTIIDYGNIPYETIINCRKLITILGRIYHNELQQKIKLFD